MFKKTVVIILSILFTVLSVFPVLAANNDKIDMGDSYLQVLGGTLIRNSKYYDGTVGDFVIDGGVTVAYKVSSNTVYACETYAEFLYSGYNYGTLTIKMTISSGSASDTGGYILVNGQIISNYEFTISDNSYIFVIKGEIPRRFEIGALFYSVQPDSLNDTHAIVTLYSQSSFIPDYSNISDEIVSNQNQNTEEIVSNQNQLQQNEKDEADSAGNDGVNSIVGGIENKGDGFFNAMGNLIASMSYNGTECKWILPPITLPKIDGVMESITLTDNLEIDFEYWISQIPTSIMRVVQAILTIAVILFCVKELYSVLSYVFTLRGG